MSNAMDVFKDRLFNVNMPIQIRTQDLYMVYEEDKESFEQWEQEWSDFFAGTSMYGRVSTCDNILQQYPEIATSNVAPWLARGVAQCGNSSHLNNWDILDESPTHYSYTNDNNPYVERWDFWHRIMTHADRWLFRNNKDHTHAHLWQEVKGLHI